MLFRRQPGPVLLMTCYLVLIMPAAYKVHCVGATSLRVRAAGHQGGRGTSLRGVRHGPPDVFLQPRHDRQRRRRPTVRTCQGWWSGVHDIKAAALTVVELEVSLAQGVKKRFPLALCTRCFPLAGKRLEMLHEQPLLIGHQRRQNGPAKAFDAGHVRALLPRLCHDSCQSLWSTLVKVQPILFRPLCVDPSPIFTSTLFSHFRTSNIVSAHTCIELLICRCGANESCMSSCQLETGGF